MNHPHLLSASQVETFHRDGMIGPFQAMSPEEMATLRPEIEEALEKRSGLKERERVHNLHLYEEVVMGLCRSSAVVDRIQCILGDDLLLWRSNFFIKEPGGLEIPWHQDVNYWPIEPAIICSAWMAIDDVDIENSCPNFIPGSHRRVIPHVTAGEDMSFHQMADPKEVDASKAVPFIMKPGEFVLFNERALHQSNPNLSERRRMGLAIRTTVPQTRILDYDSDDHGVIQLCGNDPLKFNRHVVPRHLKESRLSLANA